MALKFIIIVRIPFCPMILFYAKYKKCNKSARGLMLEIVFEFERKFVRQIIDFHTLFDMKTTKCFM